MKSISLILLLAIGYVVVNHGGLPGIELPKKYVYLDKSCPPPVQCPTIPKEYFSIETIENQICKGEIESFLVKQIKQVKVDVEEKFANY